METSGSCNNLGDLLSKKEEILAFFRQTAVNLLESRQANALRERFTVEAEALLSQKENQTKVADLLWEVGWYYPIDIYCKAHKKPEQLLLKSFLDRGVIYFQNLLSSYPYIAHKVSIFIGDLYRYSYKLCKSDTSDFCIQSYLNSLNEKPDNCYVHLKLSTIYKDKDFKLCMLYYIRYCLLKRPADIMKAFPVKNGEEDDIFTSAARSMVLNIGNAKEVLGNVEEYTNQKIRVTDVNEFLTQTDNLLALSVFTFCLNDQKRVETLIGMWCRIFCSIGKKCVDYVIDKSMGTAVLHYKRSVHTALSYCGISFSQSLAVKVVQESSFFIIILNEWLMNLSMYFTKRGLSVGLRMLIHSLLNTYVMLLNKLQHYLTPLMSEMTDYVAYTWSIQGAELLNVNCAEDVTLIHVMVSSLKHALLREDFPVNFDGEFTFHFPRTDYKILELREDQRRKPTIPIALFSKNAFINYWSFIKNSIETANLVCLLDMPSAQLIKEDENFRHTRINCELLETFILRKRIIIMECEDLNPLFFAQELVAKLTKNKSPVVNVILDPAEMMDESNRVVEISILSLQDFEKQLTFLDQDDLLPLK